MNFLSIIQVSAIIFILKPIFFINFEFPKGCGLRTQNFRTPGSKLRKTGPVGIDFITLGNDGFIITKPRGSLERSPGRRGILHPEPPDRPSATMIRSRCTNKPAHTQDPPSLDLRSSRETIKFRSNGPRPIKAGSFVHRRIMVK
jgi:hypothetical protein